MTGDALIVTASATVVFAGYQTMGKTSSTLLGNIDVLLQLSADPQARANK